MNKIIRIGKYLRVSTDKQELTLQHEKINKFIIRLKEDNPKVDYFVEDYLDDGVSGKEGVERLSLQRLLKDIKLKKINCVIITALDRLGRSLQDLLQITSTFKEHSCDFVVTEQNIDTSHPQGKLLFQILGAFAEFERSIISERMRGGRERAEKLGSKSGKPCHRPKSSIDADGVELKFKKGMSMNKISKIYGVSMTPIRRILKERGLI